MASRASRQKDNTINIHSYPVQMHVGSQKFINDDWGTMAYIIDRREIQNKFADPELRYNCIYFLFGYEDNMEMCYVGQAKIRNDGESVLARLREHDKSTTEKYCDIWDWAVVVTNKNGSWTLDDLNALEHAFYAEIPAEQNLNGNNPNAGGADFDNYIDKIEQIKALVTTIGFSIFAKKIQTENIQVISETNEFSIVEDLQNGMARIPEIVTPHKVVKAMVDMLPADVWNDKTVFLDPACKGGEYLREIYDRLMENEVMQSKYPNNIERSNHILSEQLYGIALSQVSLERTTKKLMGFGMNIRIIPNYIEILKTKFDKEVSETDKREYIMNILNKEFGKTMNIDVVIGNPPYQECNGARSQAIFDKFIKLGADVSEVSSLITPARWLTDSKYESFRKNILPKTIDITIYKDCKTLFNGINCGSVAYYTVNNSKDKKEINIILADDNINTTVDNTADFIPIDKYAISILGKCKDNSNKSSFKFLGRRTFGRSPRWSDGAPILLLDDNGDMNYITYEQAMFITNKCNSSDINNIEYTKYYRLITGSILNMSPSVIGELGVTLPNSASDFNITTLYYSDNKEDCYRCAKYVKTKLVRYLMLITLSKSQTSLSEDRLKYIPYQSYNDTSNIDWTQPVSNIDQQLYRKYNLTPEEIDYIEKTIKPME